MTKVCLPGGFSSAAVGGMSYPPVGSAAVTVGVRSGAWKSPTWCRCLEDGRAKAQICGCFLLCLYRGEGNKATVKYECRVEIEECGLSERVSWE
jgi:hypothetical protein